MSDAQFLLLLLAALAAVIALIASSLAVRWSILANDSLHRSVRRIDKEAADLQNEIWAIEKHLGISATERVEQRRWVVTKWDGTPL